MAHTKTSPSVLSSSTLTGDKVVNAKGENLGKIEDLMIDLERGRIAYAVLSFGGVLGMGSKLFALPWAALRVDTANHRIVVSADKKQLESAPGFDKDHWPDFADPTFAKQIHSHYGAQEYWTR